MTATLTIDSAGRLVLPKAFRDHLHLRKGTKIKADLVADKIELSAATDDDLQVVCKDGRLMVRGLKRPFSAVHAVRAAREEREKQLGDVLSGS